MDHRARSAFNRFAASPLDRHGEHRGDPDWLDARLSAADARFVLVWRSRMPVADAAAVLPSRARIAHLLDRAEVVLLLGEWRGHTYFAMDVSKVDEDAVAALAPGAEWVDLREAARLLPASEAALLAQARAMVHWHRRHRFCGRCGSLTRSDAGGYVRVCTNPECGARDFPRTDPAIIVLTTAADRALLGRQPRWPENRFSTIAGFVEPGESVEDAVVREVREETSVQVDAVEYHSSQPWPFPASVMLGFTAEARPQPAHPRDGELAAVRWFSRADVREGLGNGSLALPPPLSVAFHLIRDWFDAGSRVPLRELAGFGDND